MAAGIGEASAILAVAQIGISLSNSLISYIGEVQDAPFRIQRISNEVATTSERLRDIGGLVSENHKTNIFSEEGISSAIRCSDECCKIIEDVKSILRKGGWQQKSIAFDKEEIDTSLFSTLRWPFLKRSLEVPRAELQRIKIDLSLLFSSAMALGASTSRDKVKFSQDIPGLQKTRDWAARIADEAKDRAKDRSTNFTSRGKPHDAYWMDDEPELLEDFVAYQERRIREEEDKKAKELALLLQAEQEAKRKQEEEAKREIEQRAIESYKKEQDELQTRTTESKETFRAELLRLGLQLDQIALIIDNSNLDFGGSGPNANVPTVQTVEGTTSGSTTTHIDAGSTKSTNEETAPSRANGRSRRRLPWRKSQKTSGHGSPEPSPDFSLSNSTFTTETWLLDVFSNWNIQIMPSDEWLERKILKRRKREDLDVWHCFAGLNPRWRDAILQFLEARNGGNALWWSLYSIELPHQKSRMGLRGFRGPKYDGQLVKIMLFKRQDSFDALNDGQGGAKHANNGQLHDAPGTSRPANSYFNESLTNAQVHPHGNQSEGNPHEHQFGRPPRPKVSFADKVDEKTDKTSTVDATDESLRFSTEKEIQKAIKKKKKKIVGSDKERVDDINDLIVLLAHQLKLRDTLSPSQRNTLYSESTYGQPSAMKIKPHANTQFRNPEMSYGASYPVVDSNASAMTGRTEGTSIPRDYRNESIWKDGAVTRVTRPELERHRARSLYSDEEDPYVVYDSRRKPHDYENNSIIINNEPRRAPMPPGFVRHDHGPAVSGTELVVRQKSPSRPRSFERHRAREPSRRRYSSQDRDRIGTRDRDREMSLWRPPRPDEETIIRKDQRGSERENIHRRDEEIDIREREKERSFPNRDDEIIVRRNERDRERPRERESEREKYFPHRGDEIIIRRNERDRQRPEYEREEIIIRERRESSSSSASSAASRGYIGPALRRRTSTFDDGAWPDVESKALVLRTGGSRPTPGYMQEHILDRSIRVRGEQDVLSSPEHLNRLRLRSPTDSRQSSYSERDRAILPRRPSLEPSWAVDSPFADLNSGNSFNARMRNSHRKPRNRDLERVKNRHQRPRKTASSSEDDDYLTRSDRIASKQQSKPSDEEIITQTLKRFTTFQGDQPPNAAQVVSAVGSSREQNSALTRDSAIDRQRGRGRGLETMSEEPDAILKGDGPFSASQAPFYPSSNLFPPPPGLPRSPDSTSGSPRNPSAEFRRRGYDTDVPVPVYRPQEYHNFVNSPNSPLTEPEHPNKVEIDPTRLRSDGVSPAIKGSAKVAPKTVLNGKVKITKEPRVMELSDGSSEDGRRKLHKTDRKATVEDFEPEAGGVEAGQRL